MLPKLSVDKTLLKAKQYANKGNFEKAKIKFPKTPKQGIEWDWLLLDKYFANLVSTMV